MTDNSMRLDRWLWAARFFKTRALASAAIAGGKAHVNGTRAKSAKQLKVGDALRVRIGPYEWLVTVRALSERRDRQDRKSTRLNSSHQIISYAVFCLKKKINKYKS